MSISTDAYTAATGQAREATEKSVDTFKQGVERFADQANVVAKLPTVDLTQPVARYFEYVQKSVDLNRDLATKWAELVTTLSGTVREQAEKVTGIVKDQTDTVADLAVKQAEKAERPWPDEQAKRRPRKPKREKAKAGGQGRRAGSRQSRPRSRPARPTRV